MCKKKKISNGKGTIGLGSVWSKGENRWEEEKDAAKPGSFLRKPKEEGVKKNRLEGWR